MPYTAVRKKLKEWELSYETLDYLWKVGMFESSIIHNNFLTFWLVQLAHLDPYSFVNWDVA